MKYFTIIKSIIVIFCVISFCSCIENLQEENDIFFKLNGKSTLTIVNNSGDSSNIHFKNYIRIPLFSSEEYDTILANGESFSFEFTAQGFDYDKIEINSISYKIFNSFNKKIRIELDKDTSYFNGDYSLINNHLAKRKGSYYSVNNRWIRYVNASGNGESSFDNLYRNFKLATIENLKEIESEKSSIPAWYYQLTKELTLYQEAWFLLNSLSYRKKMLNYNDSIPIGYIDSVVRELSLFNNKLMGFKDYQMFLHDYLIQLYNPLSTEQKEEKMEGFIKNFTKFSSKKLTQPYSDYYITGYISTIISSDKSRFKNEYLDVLEFDEYKNLLLKQFNETELLPEGSLMPNVQLLNERMERFDLTQLKDSILLINFWASYCMPCIKKFPSENLLVEKYENFPVKIINVCLETDSNSFKRLVNKHGLKTLNLFAVESSSKVTNKEFEINGLPHSVLVNSDLKIIKNKIGLIKAEQIIDSLFKIN